MWKLTLGHYVMNQSSRSYVQGKAPGWGHSQNKGTEVTNKCWLHILGMSPTCVFLRILQSGLSASANNSSGNDCMHSYLLTDEKRKEKKALFSPWWVCVFGYCRLHCVWIAMISILSLNLDYNKTSCGAVWQVFENWSGKTWWKKIWSLA